MDMDDMMNMPFDQLRGHVTANNNSAVASTMFMGRGGGGGSQSMLMGPAAGTALLGGPRVAEVPDHPQELQVFFFGPGAERAAKAQGVHVVDAKLAAAACKGKRDFILFEDLDDAVVQNTPVVLVLPLGAGRGEIGQAQAYLASSLARWLGEQKTDGSGRPYGESKDEDPTLRKHFTRAQILAIKQVRHHLARPPNPVR